MSFLVYVGAKNQTFPFGEQDFHIVVLHTPLLWNSARIGRRHYKTFFIKKSLAHVLSERSRLDDPCERKVGLSFFNQITITSWNDDSI